VHVVNVNMEINQPRTANHCSEKTNEQLPSDRCFCLPVDTGIWWEVVVFTDLYSKKHIHSHIQSSQVNEVQTNPHKLPEPQCVNIGWADAVFFWIHWKKYFTLT
jgi:hypothetical protein